MFVRYAHIYMYGNEVELMKPYQLINEVLVLLLRHSMLKFLAKHKKVRQIANFLVTKYYRIAIINKWHKGL